MISTEAVLLAVQFALVLGAAIAAITAFQCADQARRHRSAVENERLAWQQLARECQAATLRCDGLQESLDSLRKQHQRLHGKFHATLREPAAAERGESAEETRARLRALHGLPRVNGGENGER